jgi:hypothetical protein
LASNGLFNHQDHGGPLGVMPRRHVRGKEESPARAISLSDATTYTSPITPARRFDATAKTEVC